MNKKEMRADSKKQVAPVSDDSDYSPQTTAEAGDLATGESITLAEIAEQLAAHGLPQWNAIPDFGLYMDQVLVLVNRYLGEYPGQEDKQLTGAMVNNYVKMGIVPAPQKKKYSRTHIAHLLVICTLKSVLPIDSIHRLLQTNLAVCPDEGFYNTFATFYSQSNQAAATALHGTEDDTLQAILLASLRSQAEQTIAVAALTTLSQSYKSEPGNKKKSNQH